MASAIAEAKGRTEEIVRACFVAADAAGHSETVGRALAEGHPVVLVFPNGDEVVIEPGENGVPARVEVRDSAGKPLAA